MTTSFKSLPVARARPLALVMVCRSLYVLLLWSWYRRKAWAEDRGGGQPREKVRLWDGGKPAKHPNPAKRTLTSLERGGRGFFFEVLAGMCGAASKGVDAWCSRQRDYWEGERDAQTELQKVLIDIEAQREEERASRFGLSEYETRAYMLRVRARLEGESAQNKESDESGRTANVLPDWQRSLRKMWRWPPSGETEAQRTVNTLHEDIKAQCEEAQVLISIMDRARGEGETAQASTERLERLRKVHHDATLVSQKGGAKPADTTGLTSVLDSIEKAISEVKGSTERTRPSASSSELIADELARRLTWSALYVSVAADIDLALDWVFFSQMVSRSNLEKSEDDFIPPRFMIVTAVFAALGTVLWALAAFDLLAWGLDYISLGFFKRAPSPDLYPSRGVVLLLNLALEDVPQIVISSVVTAAYDGGGTAISSLALANIVTSVYSLLFKVMATLESSAGEYTLPAMISVAPFARAEMEERRRARDASSRTAREYALAAANQMRLLEGTFDKDELRLGAWSDVPPADTVRGNVWRSQLRAAKTVKRLHVQKLRGKAEVEDVFEVLNQENSSIVTLDLDGPYGSDDPTIDGPGILAVAKALKTNEALKTLWLNNNSIGDAGAQALAEALQTNGALTTLSLSHNSIGDAGARALAEALQTNKALTRLYLDNNSIGAAGAEALDEAGRAAKADGRYLVISRGGQREERGSE